MGNHVISIPGNLSLHIPRLLFVRADPDAGIYPQHVFNSQAALLWLLRLLSECPLPML
jgi:hypothetical protein